jgi:hypothetical protein
MCFCWHISKLSSSCLTLKFNIDWKEDFGPIVQPKSTNFWKSSTILWMEHDGRGVTKRREINSDFGLPTETSLPTSVKPKQNQARRCLGEVIRASIFCNTWIWLAASEVQLRNVNTIFGTPMSQSHGNQRVSTRSRVLPFSRLMIWARFLSGRIKALSSALDIPLPLFYALYHSLRIPLPIATLLISKYIHPLLKITKIVITLGVLKTIQTQKM